MFTFIANFKQNFSLNQSQEWLDSFLNSYTPHPQIQVILAPSFIALHYFAHQINSKENLFLASQDVSHFSPGAHTGRVGAQQLQGLVHYSLIGHSEMRQEAGDTDDTVAKKAQLLVKQNIIPIVCLDKPYLETQISKLKHQLLELPDLLFAYEPLAAIGTGSPETPDNSNAIAFKIKSLTKRTYPVLYGGSVDEYNIDGFLKAENLSGALIGTSALNPNTFLNLLTHAQKQIS